MFFYLSRDRIWARSLNYILGIKHLSLKFKISNNEYWNQALNIIAISYISFHITRLNQFAKIAKKQYKQYKQYKEYIQTQHIKMHYINTNNTYGTYKK